MIELTTKAIEKVREIMHDQGIAEGGLRVGVKGGGCSGMSYNLAIDTEQRPGDKVFEKDGVKVFVDMKDFLFLDSSPPHHKEEGLMHRGFTLVHPNSSGACGCGESFAV